VQSLCATKASALHPTPPTETIVSLLRVRLIIESAVVVRIFVARAEYQASSARLGSVQLELAHASA